MATPPVRYSQLQWVHTLVNLAGFVGGVVLIGLGCVAVDAQQKTLMIVAGAFLLLVAIMLLMAMPLLLRMEATFARQLSELRELRQCMAKQTDRLNVIAENTGLSDAAKSLSHRPQELAALTEAIREEIRQGRWESATNFVQELERRFGAGVPGSITIVGAFGRSEKSAEAAGPANSGKFLAAPAGQQLVAITPMCDVEYQSVAGGIENPV